MTNGQFLAAAGKVEYMEYMDRPLLKNVFQTPVQSASNSASHALSSATPAATFRASSSRPIQRMSSMGLWKGADFFQSETVTHTGLGFQRRKRTRISACRPALALAVTPGVFSTKARTLAANCAPPQYVSAGARPFTPTPSNTSSRLILRASAS